MIALLITALACARIASTYSVFSATYDEGAHVAAGLQWLDRGQYSYDRSHPPFARILMAAGPYLDGIRSTGGGTMLAEGRAVLYERGQYQRTLRLARMGILPFFVVGALALWLWARLLVGPVAGALALAVFSSTPVVLGHSGVATTDAPLLGMLAVLLYVATRWLATRTPVITTALGVTAGLALATKFSALPFAMVAAGLVVVVYLWWMRRGAGGSAHPRDAERTGLAVPMSAIRSLLVVAAAASWVVFAVYRFHFGRVAGLLIPAPGFVQGLRLLAEHNRVGQVTYLLGETRSDGFLAFFPVALAVKTPLTVLLLGFSGLWIVTGRAWRTRELRAIVPTAFFVAVMGVAMSARIDLGVRHILPVYLALSLGAGAALHALWKAPKHRVAARAAGVVLGGLLAVESATAHPDYLAYFNLLGGKEPERILVDSDLDWGQDLVRLHAVLHERGITEVAINDLTSDDVAVPCIPTAVSWGFRDRPTGWVVIGVTPLRRGAAIIRNGEWTLLPDAYSWLRTQRPVARIGRSLLLYYIDDDGS
ncbi:MAG: hypothetical protein U0163_06965 [Gemmatimonadaceae bacterium]